jgi:hypothetical protein
VGKRARSTIKPGRQPHRDCSFRHLFDFGCVDPESVGQVLQMFLFSFDDFSQHFTEGKLAYRVGLANALAIIDERLPFTFQIEAEHFFGFIRHFYLGRFVRGRAVEVIIFSQFGGVCQFFGGCASVLCFMYYACFKSLTVNDVEMMA